MFTQTRMSLSALVLATLFSFYGLAQQSKSDAGPEKDLVGAWRLVSVETIRPNGEIIYPFYGKHPEGLIIYDRSGWMSVQIVSDPQPTAPKGDSRDAFRSAPLEEKAAAADGYSAYFGRWTIDAASSTVTHHLKNSLYPGERGSNFVRHFTVIGNRLTLIMKVHEMGEEHERKLVWQRATAE